MSFLFNMRSYESLGRFKIKLDFGVFGLSFCWKKKGSIIFVSTGKRSSFSSVLSWTTHLNVHYSHHSCCFRKDFSTMKACSAVSFSDPSSFISVNPLHWGPLCLITLLAISSSDQSLPSGDVLLSYIPLE